MKNCLDCLSCKINIALKTLRCSPYKNSPEATNWDKPIKLSPINEFPEYYGIKIRKRKSFYQAESCPDFENMD